MLAWLTVTDRRKKEESQKIDDLPVSATCRSGTSAMLSSKFKVPLFIMSLIIHTKLSFLAFEFYGIN